MKESKFDIFLKKVFEATQINSQNELASILKINRSAISQARKKDSIPDKWILQLFKLYGLSPDWLEKGIGKAFINKNDNDQDIDRQNFKKIPKVKARLCAGDGSFEIGSEIEGYYSFNTNWLKSKGLQDKMVLMDIFGNSMEPELKNGDTVLIDETQKDILAGAIYAVGVDDTIMVKRLEKLPNKLVLLSDNKDYSSIYLEKEEMNNVRIIGKVLWICRDLK